MVEKFTDMSLRCLPNLATPEKPKPQTLNPLSPKFRFVKLRIPRFHGHLIPFIRRNPFNLNLHLTRNPKSQTVDQVTLTPQPSLNPKPQTLICKVTATVITRVREAHGASQPLFPCLFLVLSSVKLSDTQVCEP